MRFDTELAWIQGGYKFLKREIPTTKLTTSRNICRSRPQRIDLAGSLPDAGGPVERRSLRFGLNRVKTKKYCVYLKMGMGFYVGVHFSLSRASNVVPENEPLDDWASEFPPAPEYGSTANVRFPRLPPQNCFQMENRKPPID
ncbi:hypothetical protein [Vineibacter terrae]|uniref:hypothetical protein n=1 Tax=Vineibacter terrae TaxID=2586908 RepID=UPI001C497FB9|nr:hypothetical protein [Vineibacter terrae]